MDGALAVSEHVAASSQATWGRERIDLIKRTICPKGITDDEFALFIEQCRRSGLDPLIKEAFCVPRRQNIGSREQPKWINKHEFQPSEAGMLARAERFPDFKGIQASAAYAEDELLIDQGKGEVTHRFNPAKRKGALVGAWARVVREGKLPVVVWLDFAGYVQSTPLWGKIPATMIEKCARVAALRKAYTEAFGGLYVKEEMPAEEYEAPVAGPSAPALGDGRERIVDAVAIERLAEPAPVEVDSAGSEQSRPAPEAKTQRRKPIDLDALKRMDRSKVAVAFGDKKGTAIAKLSDQELTSVSDEGAARLKGNEGLRWARAVEEQLLLLGMEMEARIARAVVSEREEAAANMKRDGGH